MDVWVMCCITHTHIHTHMHSHALRNYCYCCYLCSTLGCYLLANTCFWIIFYVHFGLTCVDTHPHTHTHPVSTPPQVRPHAPTHTNILYNACTRSISVLIACCLLLTIINTPDLIFLGLELPTWSQTQLSPTQSHTYTHATMCVFVCVALYIYVCVCLCQF